MQWQRYSVLSVLGCMALARSLTLSGEALKKESLKKRSQNLLVGWHEGLMLHA